MELSKIHHYKLWSFSLPSPLPIASLGTYDPSTFKLDGEEAVPDPVEDSPDVPAPTKCGSCRRVVILCLLSNRRKSRSQMKDPARRMSLKMFSAKQRT